MIQKATKLLEESAESICAVVKTVNQEQAIWKPSAQEWSILEVFNHLVDEEREDFRVRFQSILKDASKTWKAIDPITWVTERNYNTRNLKLSIESFKKERKTSLEYLQTLVKPDLEVAYEHPQIGAFKAKDLLASWLAHDLLHLRQITRLKYQYLSKDFSIAYAGNW